MREGAWINIATGTFEWITEHCDWIKLPQNASKISLPDSIFQQIKDMPNDYNITTVPNAKKFFGL